MPQVIVIALAGAGVVAGYKWLSRKLAELSEAELARAEAERSAAAAPKEMGRLVWDDETQAYRPSH